MDTTTPGWTIMGSGVGGEKFIVKPERLLGELTGGESGVGRDGSEPEWTRLRGVDCDVIDDGMFGLHRLNIKIFSILKENAYLTTFSLY